MVDEFKCYAIEHSNAVVGYLQYSFFREENIFFFEYLCIRPTPKPGLVPSDAIEAIRDHLAQNYQPGFTIVFEIAQKKDQDGSWRADKRLIGYFRRLGFRQLGFEYRYPILQSYEGEASYPANLMVHMPNDSHIVNASELRTILRCIYFKHYLRWDRPFLDPERFAERERLINELYAREVSGIGHDSTFGTSGDDYRSKLMRFFNRQPRVSALVGKIFRPKLLRLIILAAVLLGVEQVLGNVYLLMPFVLTVAALYCLAEDTESTRKLFVLIISKFKLGRLRA